MAGYNKDLDKAMFVKTVEVGKDKLGVSVMSYNGKTGKLQLSREEYVAAKGEWMFVKLGRLTKEEAVALLPVIQEAITTM